MDDLQIRSTRHLGLLQLNEDVDPNTATTVSGYLVVSGLVAMPLDGVSWEYDRTNDLAIYDENGTEIGTLCFLVKGSPIKVEELTKWQYVAYLADCDMPASTAETHRLNRDYVVINEGDLGRYLSEYIEGSALWGGYHHGSDALGARGHRSEVKAISGVKIPTLHHRLSFRLATQAINPQDQFLKIYQSIELLFDYITFRKLTKVGNDLNGFGKVIAQHQRGELDRLKSIVKEFCLDIDRLTAKLVLLSPYVDRAKEIFHIHSKDGNPLNDDKKWEAFAAIIESDTLNRAGAKSLAGTPKAFDELIAGIAAYQVYRIRSSIAHSRIGEFLLTDQDDEFITGFGVRLVEEVAIQIFSSVPFKSLIT